MNTTERFSGRAGVYQASRPGYPAALSEHLASLGMRGARVADIGAGTGIFSRLLLELGCTVFAVEPNSDMRHTAELGLKTCDRFSIGSGTAENTGLPEASVSFVTAAQAFHWFDPDAFRQECLRILELGGLAVFVWNSRRENDEAVQKNADICRRYCSGFYGFSGGNWRKTEENLRLFFGREPEALHIPNDLFYTKEKFLQRNLSSSYSLKQGEEGYEDYLEALSALFDQYAQDGVLRVPNETAAFWGCPAI